MVGFAVALVALSPWLVLRGRAVYRDGPAFQRWIWNTAPLWGPVTTGVILLWGVATVFGGWSTLCLPDREWSAVGVVFIGIGVATALIAVARMIVGRVRVGNGTSQSRKLNETSEDLDEAAEDSGATNTLSAGVVEAGPRVRTRNMPIEQRRVIIAYALTYAPAIIIIIIGVGLL